MRKVLHLMVIAVLVLSGIAAYAGQYTFSPKDADLQDLPHGSYFIWGDLWSNVPAGEQITSAAITFHKIYDYVPGEANTLFVHLFDTYNGTGYVSNNNATTTYTTTTYTGTDSGGKNNIKDQFANSTGQVLLGTWSDPYGLQSKAADVTFDILPANYSWITDGNFAFGIDPDCHFYNCGVTFDVCTKPINTPPVTVPEPMSIMLCVFGLSSLTGLKKLRKS